MTRSNVLSAATAAFGPALVAAAFATSGTWTWAVAALALPLGLLVRPRSRSAWGPWLVGLVLAAIAAVTAGRARHLLDVASAREWPTYDLARDVLPASPPEFVAVTGVPRTGIVLDEYAVAPGGLPDQSRAAEAVLVPLGAAEDPEVPTRSFVVARVRPAELAAFADGEPATVRGRAGPLAPDLLATIVDLAGAGERPSTGVLVDTLEMPAPGVAWTQVAIASALALLSAVAHVFGVRSR